MPTAPSPFNVIVLADAKVSSSSISMSIVTVSVDLRPDTLTSVLLASAIQSVFHPEPEAMVAALGAVGADVSMVTDSPLEAIDSLPAASICLAVMVYPPSLKVRSDEQSPPETVQEDPLEDGS